MKPDEATNGAQALEKMRIAYEFGNPYQLVMTDFKMPEMDGRSFGLVVRNEEIFDKTILILFDSAVLADDKELKGIGFDKILTKPVRQSELFNTIVETIKNNFTENGDVTVAPRDVAEGAGTSIKILLAEDNPVNREVAMEMISSSGYKCDWVLDGVEAVESFKKENYDLVFMDCQMPRMDGFEATRTIRQWESEQGKRNGFPTRVPIVAMTAHAMKEDREE